MIEIITGLPGMGKTATAARWAYYKGFLRGKKVYANFPLKGAEYYYDVFKLLGNVQNSLIVVDEMGIVFDQLRMYDVPDHVWMELRQHRKDGVDLLGTAQCILDVAYPMRRLIQFEWNIYFKALKLVAVTCRNPQPRGDTYGKHFWLLRKKIFSLYDTYHKVGDNLEQSLELEQSAINSFDRFSKMQDSVVDELLVMNEYLL